MFQLGGSRRKGHEDVYKNGSKKKVYRSRDEVADSPSTGDSGEAVISNFNTIPPSPLSPRHPHILVDSTSVQVNV